MSVAALMIPSPLQSGASSPACLCSDPALPRRSWRLLTESKLQAAAVVLIIVAAAAPARGQGGAAISVGLSVQNSANAAAQRSSENTAGAARGRSAAEAGSEAYLSEEEMGLSDEERGGESEMGLEPGGYGQGGGRFGSNQGGPGGAIDSGTAAAMAAGSLAEFFERPITGAAGAQRRTLREQAALALHQGQMRRALALFHAHLVAERDTAASGLDAVQFSPLLRRPAWAIRVGVSLNTKVPADLVDDPQPIRDGDKPASSPRRGEFAAEMEEESAAGPERAMARGGAGQEPADAGLSGEEMGFEEGMGLERAASAGRVAAAAATSSQATAAAEAMLDRDLGLIADVLKVELNKRIEAGTFGRVVPELISQGAALAADVAAPRDAIAAGGLLPSGSAAVVWIPGVEFLGSGIPEQSIEKAREHEIDVLLHFEVIVKQTRGEESQYMARLRVVNVASGDTLGASRLMRKRDVNIAARRSGLRTVVEELLQPAFEAIDTKAALRPMPQLVPQHAVSRIDSLLASQQVSRMHHLAEIVMFHHRGLIDEEQLEQAMFFAVGEDGLRLLHAEYDQRVELATEMAVGELE